MKKIFLILVFISLSNVEPGVHIIGTKILAIIKWKQ